MTLKKRLTLPQSKLSVPRSKNSQLRCRSVKNIKKQLIYNNGNSNEVKTTHGEVKNMTKLRKFLFDIIVHL